MSAVHHFMGNYVINHPIRPVFDFFTDANMTVCWASPAAAPQARLHVAYPADAVPVQASIEMLPVDMIGALLQVRIRTADILHLNFIHLHRNLLKQGVYLSPGEPVRAGQMLLSGKRSQRVFKGLSFYVTCTGLQLHHEW
jgi:hypothetical protein